jgi:hypothetical protein
LIPIADTIHWLNVSGNMPPGPHNDENDGISWLAATLFSGDIRPTDAGYFQIRQHVYDTDNDENPLRLCFFAPLR